MVRIEAAHSRPGRQSLDQQRIAKLIRDRQDKFCVGDVRNPEVIFQGFNIFPERLLEFVKRNRPYGPVINNKNRNRPFHVCPATITLKKYPYCLL